MFPHIPNLPSVPPETTKLLIQVILGTGVVATIVQAFLTYRLTRKIEAQKAILQRGTAVHALQVSSLTPICSMMSRIHIDLLRALSKLGDNDQLASLKADLDQLSHKRLPELEEEIAKSKLLIPSAIISDLYRFVVTAQLTCSKCQIMIIKIDGFDTASIKDALSESVQIVADILMQVEVAARLLVGSL